MRTEEEIQRQINGLENMKKVLPEVDFFGNNNHDQINAQIEVLQGLKKPNDFWINEKSEDYVDESSYFKDPVDSFFSLITSKGLDVTRNYIILEQINFNNMSKKSQQEITEERIKQGVKVSSIEAHKLTQIETGKSHNDFTAIKQSGFFDLTKIGENIITKSACPDPEHKPPMHLYIPPGKGYKHICPTCGKEEILIPPQISYNTNDNKTNY